MLMLVIKLKTAEVANLPPILSAKRTSHNVTVHVFQAICESICAGTSFFRAFSTQHRTNYQGSTFLSLFLVHKLVSELSSKSLLTIINSQDSPTG